MFVWTLLVALIFPAAATVLRGKQASVKLTEEVRSSALSRVMKPLAISEQVVKQRTLPGVSTTKQDKFGLTAYGDSPTSATYFQINACKYSNCEGETFQGVAYLMNNCFIYDYINSNGTLIPFYVNYFPINNGMTVNASISFNSDCSSPLQVINIGLNVGCNPSDTGKNSVRLSFMPMPSWPTGQNGYAINVFASSSDCYNQQKVVTSFYGKFGVCYQIITSTGSVVSTTATGCSTQKNQYSLSSWTDNDQCQGPATGTVVLSSTDKCGEANSVDGVYGYDSLQCFDSTPYSKCYNAFGYSTPPCNLALSNNALTFTCPEAGYKGCNVGEFNNPNKNQAQVFGCCAPY